MKKWANLGIMLMMTAVFSVGVSCLALAAEGNSEKPTISVHGTGKVAVEPDKAELSFSIETEGKTAKQAQEENSTVEKKVFDALKKAGVKEEDIKTQYTSIDPSYKYDEKTQERTVIGYQAYYSFTVTTMDIDKVETYLDTAVKAGVTRSNGVEFMLSDPNKQYGEALHMAVDNAKSSAQSIVNSIGGTMGKIVSVTENRSNDSYNTVRMESSKADSAGTGSAMGMDIRHDKINVEAYVTMVFECE